MLEEATVLVVANAPHSNSESSKIVQRFIVSNGLALYAQFDCISGLLTMLGGGGSGLLVVCKVWSVGSI